MISSEMHALTEHKIAPWLQTLWEGIRFDRFPNAVLVHGQAGIGKFEFCLELAKALLCESNDANQKKPCNHCDGCCWFDSASHPDFIALVPETHRKFLPDGDFDVEQEPTKKSKASLPDGEVAEKKEKKNISIEETRNVIEGLSIGSHRGGNRIILVYPLETLRSDSANTLLKSLEEPPSNTIFILLADRLDRVLPTIRSRCQLLTVPRPERSIGLSWLQDQIARTPGLKVTQDEIETIYDEQGGAPYAVLDSLVARNSKDEKDELSIGIHASRYLLQAMSQGGRINWLDASEKCHKASYGVLLAAMQRWTSDLQSVLQGGAPRFYPKHERYFQALAQQAHLEKLIRFWKNLVVARRHENHPLATRIQLESLLSQYQQIFEG